MQSCKSVGAKGAFFKGFPHYRTRIYRDVPDFPEQVQVAEVGAQLAVRFAQYCIFQTQTCTPSLSPTNDTSAQCNSSDQLSAGIQSLSGRSPWIWHCFQRSGMESVQRLRSIKTQFVWLACSCGSVRPKRPKQTLALWGRRHIRRQADVDSCVQLALYCWHLRSACHGTMITKECRVTSKHAELVCTLHCSQSPEPGCMLLTFERCLRLCL